MDFASFYTAAQRLNAAQPLYQPHLNPALGGSLYVYSPLLALLMRPLAHFSFHTATKVWFFVNAASLIAAVMLYGAAARISWRSLSLLGILLLVSFRFWDTTMNFGLGQSNSVMLALIAAMLWADSRKRWWLMGALIALTALFKVWLIGIVLYLLLRRRWREAAFAIGAFLVALGGLFSLVGWPELPSYLSCMVQAKAFGERHAVMNSIVGFADLHLRTNPIVSPLINSHFGYAAFAAVCVLGLLWGFTALWRVLKNPTPLEARLSFGLVLVSVLLLLPSYENGYSVYCFPLLWTLLGSPDGDGKHSRRVSQIMLAGGILFYLIFSRSWPVYAPFSPAYQHGMRSLIVSMSFYGTVFIWGVSVYCLRRLGVDSAAKSGRAGSARPEFGHTEKAVLEGRQT